MKFLTSTLIILLLTLPACTHHSYTRSPEEIAITKLKLSDATTEKIGERDTAITQATSALPTNHPWAGHYYAGDGRGFNISLHLAPNAGFTYA